MTILEDVFEELKLLNNSSHVLSTELLTVDSSTTQERAREAPVPKEETTQLKSVEEVKETSADLAKDYVLPIGKEFLRKANTSDKGELRNKLDKLGMDKLSITKEEHYEKIVGFMNMRINV